MMKKISYCFLFMLVFSVYAQNENLPVISNVKELEGVKSKKIIWEKDGAKMVQIPANPSGTGGIKEPVYNHLGDIITPAQIAGATEVFFMDVYEVTVGQFKKFLKSSDHKPDEAINWNKVYKYSPTDNHPMVCVNLHEATAYAKWAGKRLPTEWEWGFAARGGLIDKKYSWGDDQNLASDYANYNGTTGKDKWKDTTAPVGSFKPNGYGLYDTAGNVSEWCQDWHSIYPKDNVKVLRGGGWDSSGYFLRLADCGHSDPGRRPGSSGFRCVLGSN